MRKIKKQWVVSKRHGGDIVSDLLANRGMTNVERFLHPKFDRDIYNPHFLPNFDLAINRISEAINNQERIGLFGDYDADGVPGTALLYLALQKLGVADISVFIPRRNTGYGLSIEGIDKFNNDGVKLMIAIDCGINSVILQHGV